MQGIDLSAWPTNPDTLTAAAAAGGYGLRSFLLWHIATFRRIKDPWERLHD